jgi:uncharacterized protein (DUF1501 family)
MSSPFCPGPMPRREFLRVGTLALGGLTLAEVLAARAAGGQQGCDTSVILFWMWGGPSQLETFDMKPAAPSEYRGPLRPIRTNVPGIEICEYLPRLAQRADRFSLIRSLHHEMSAHNDGSIEVLTGKTPRVPDVTSQAHSEHPDFGMVTARLRGPRADGLPQYVGVQRAPFMTNPAYLGVAHRAFDTGDPSQRGFSPPNLALVTGVDNRRLDDRRSLIGQFDRFHRAADASGAMEGIDHFRADAFQLLTSRRVASAFDLSHEAAGNRDRYGRHRWGQSCLLARRLVEAGAAVVNIDATATCDTSKNFSWDDHAGAFHLDYAQRERLPQMDQALSALLDDLDSRSLNKRVLVLACGEFGRTPRVSHAPVNFSGQIGLGRDHWPQAFSALIAGGGLRMGQIVGETNSKAEFPLHNPLTPQDLMATVYRHLGIDPAQTFADFSGRPVPILLSGRPISQLI